MDRLLTRRRFGQVAIAGTTIVGLGYLTGNKTLAKSKSNDLYGITADVKTGTLNIKSVKIPSLQGLNETKNENLPNLLGEVLDETKNENLVNLLGEVLDETRNFNKQDAELFNTLEELTGFSSVDGELQLTTSSVDNLSDINKNPKKGKKQNNLKKIGRGNSNTLTITGLDDDEKIRSVEALDKDSLLAIVNKKSVFGSGRIVEISRSRGNLIATRFPLPQTQNFSTLTESPDGTIYASSTDPTGYTNIVRIDLADRKVTKLVQLNFKGKVWNNGLAGLAVSPLGDIIALTSPRYVPENNLYHVNLKTGALTLLLRRFNANKITFLG